MIGHWPLNELPGSSAVLRSGARIPDCAEGGRGPLAAGLSTHPVGYAHVHGSTLPDLFLAAHADALIKARAQRATEVQNPKCQKFAA